MLKQRLLDQMTLKSVLSHEECLWAASIANMPVGSAHAFISTFCKKHAVSIAISKAESLVVHAICTSMAACSDSTSCIQNAACRSLRHKLDIVYLEDLFHLLGLQDEVYSAP